jgi:hypothetical protein
VSTVLEMLIRANDVDTEIVRSDLCIIGTGADADTLTRLLARDLSLFPYGVSDDELRQRSRATITSDFTDANTLAVQGWILSRTELRLCALAALLRGRG